MGVSRRMVPTRRSVKISSWYSDAGSTFSSLVVCSGLVAILGRIAPLGDKPSGLVVGERLFDLPARIHHEVPTRDHQLVDRLAAEQQAAKILHHRNRSAGTFCAKHAPFC